MEVTDYNGESLDLTNQAKRCAGNRFEGNDQDAEEDCLTVNIYTNKGVLERGDKVPIIYYIHGGGFGDGSNEGDWRKMVEFQGVMVVSIAYRLGVYGFLWTEDNLGNWGIQDQRMAMKWAQTWAPHFGGDTSQANVQNAWFALFD